MDASGDFVVAWADSVAGQRYTAKTRAFSSTGTALTPITEITSSSSTASSIQPDVALGPGGVLTYAWLDGRTDVDKGRIYAKTATIVGVSHAEIEPGAAPLGFGLESNYPNPFNPETKIGYRTQETGGAKVSILDLLGREISVLVNQDLPAGHHTTTWNASGRSSGIYIVLLASGGRIDQRKVLLLR
jgi:hypothetical protein